MDSKTIYENTAAIAAALPEPQREMFADLLTELTSTQASNVGDWRRNAVIVWLRQAGWLHQHA